MSNQSNVKRMDYFNGLVEKAIEGSEANIVGDGSKFEAQIISDKFDGLTPVQRHKLVYAVLDDHIKSGAIHALTIKAFTKSEWAAKTSG